MALLPAGAFALAEDDLRDRADAPARLAQLTREEALAPFDLARGPLIRARLLRLADDDALLLITQHHIVSDGWSLGILVNELSALYRAFVQGRPDPLPPLALHYPDYAAWQPTARAPPPPPTPAPRCPCSWSRPSPVPSNSWASATTAPCS